MSLRSFDNPNSIEARQFLLDRKCERLHPKRHRTGPRKAANGRKKKARHAMADAIRKKARSKYLAAARAYWSGDAESHP